MQPARGDQKPCTIADCDGIMQFGRRPLNEPRPSADARKPLPTSFDAPGWICSREAAHFREFTRGEGT